MSFKDMLSFLSIEITNCCNLNCVHCGAPNLSGSISLSYKSILELEKSLSSFPNLKRISLSGGEPLLHPDLFEIIKLFSNKYKIFIATNGTLLTEDKAKQLKESGLGTCLVSLDGPKEIHEKIRGKGNFEKTIHAVKLLKQNKIRTSLKMTLNKLNFQHVTAFLEIAKDLDVEEIAIKRTIPAGKKINNRDILTITPDEYYSTQLEVKTFAEKYPKIKERFINRDPVVSPWLYQISPSKNTLGGCLAGISVASILPNGDVTPCSFIKNSAGNIHSQSLLDIWENSRVFNDIRKSRLRGKTCDKHCKFKLLCGGCRAYAYSLTGDLNGKDPCCLLPFTIN